MKTKKHITDLWLLNKIVNLDGKKVKVERIYRDNYGLDVCLLRYENGSSIEATTREVKNLIHIITKVNYKTK